MNRKSGNSLHSGNRCVKSVQIRSFFWSVFSCIRTENGKKSVQIRSFSWSVFSCIRAEYGEKSVQIRSFFWSVFSCIRTENGVIYGVNLCIQFECRKIRTRNRIQSEYRKIRARKNAVFGHCSHSGSSVKKTESQMRQDSSSRYFMTKIYLLETPQI